MTTANVIIICVTAYLSVAVASRAALEVAKLKYGQSGLTEPTQEDVEKSIEENAKNAVPDLVSEIMKAIDEEE